MKTVLITGANGEVGHAILPVLKSKSLNIVGLDISDIDESLKQYCNEFIKGTILNKDLLNTLFSRYNFDTIFHLGSLLSTAAEKDPDLAQSVNAGGTAALLSVANNFAQKNKSEIKFIFPSTIAVYGIPDIKTKNEHPIIKENEFLNPITIYGITKLYAENLGKYFSTNYKMLEPESSPLIDFRAIRFPGIISAQTMPTGGTSDYGPEMIHTAAQGRNYESFVREDTTLPFMVMPDAIDALIQLSEVPKEKLTRKVYNISAFSIAAKDIANLVLKVFPDTAISYDPHPARQKIVDSWPANIDDAPAKNDWGWSPKYDVQKAFEAYLIPEIQNKYSK